MLKQSKNLKIKTQNLCTPFCLSFPRFQFKYFHLTSSPCLISNWSFPSDRNLNLHNPLPFQNVINAIKKFNEKKLQLSRAQKSTFNFFSLSFFKLSFSKKAIERHKNESIFHGSDKKLSVYTLNFVPPL